MKQKIIEFFAEGFDMILVIFILLSVLLVLFLIFIALPIVAFKFNFWLGILVCLFLIGGLAKIYLIKMK